MPTFKSRFVFLYFLLLSVNVVAQQTIDYVSGFGNPDNVSSSCNLFNISPLYSVGTFKHWPVSGGILRVKSSPIELKTRGGQGLSTTRGAAYAIEYSIKAGYKYSISINAYRIEPQNNAKLNFEIGARTTLPNPNSDGTAPTACSSVTLNQLTAVQTGKITEGLIENDNATNIQVLQNWTASSASSFFTVLAYGGDNGEDASLFINSIAITETAPTPAFTINSTSLQCGSTSNQVFTITNVNNSPGITNYTWNLGSSNNGWLYLGNAAPQTISTGTTNTITLTPVCGSALSNIAATVTANSTNYQSTGGVVTITNATQTIQGNSSLCDATASYSINLLCNSSVNWVSSDPSVATVPSTGNPVTVTKIGSGTFTLTANFTGNCGVSSASLTITSTTVPTANTLYALYSTDGSSNYLQEMNCLKTYSAANATYSGDVTVSDAVATSFGWAFVSKNPSNAWASINSSSDGKNATISVKPAGASAVYRLISFSDCGSYSSDFTFVADGPCYFETRVASSDASILPDSSLSIKVFPNPVLNTCLVSINANKTGNTIKEIKLFNSFGLPVKQMRYSSSLTAQSINVQDLKQGVYIIAVYNGEKWIEGKFIKQ